MINIRECFQWFVENMLCLLSNAIKYGAEAVVVVVRCFKTDQGQLMVEVEDSGLGISEEKRPALFEPFLQVDREVGGTGLGLYSLSKRIESMSGQCGIRDRNDGKQGCCFWFSIPYVPEITTTRKISVNKLILCSAAKVQPLSDDHDGDTSAASVTHDAGLVSSSSFNTHLTTEDSTHRDSARFTVLLIDDAVVIQKTIGGALRRRHFDVTLASNGLIGLNMMKEKLFDVVLMDLQMPVMDGHEAIKNLRLFEKENDVPHSERQIVIGISANADDETIALTALNGMDHFLPKPFSIEDFEKACVELHIDAFVDMYRSNSYYAASCNSQRKSSGVKEISMRTLKESYEIYSHA